MFTFCRKLNKNNEPECFKNSWSESGEMIPDLLHVLLETDGV